MVKELESPDASYLHSNACPETAEPEESVTLTQAPSGASRTHAGLSSSTSKLSERVCGVCDFNLKSISRPMSTSMWRHASLPTAGHHHWNPSGVPLESYEVTL